MAIFAPRAGWPYLVALACLFGIGWPGAAQAPQAQADAKVEALEKRVQDLEAHIRRQDVERAKRPMPISGTSQPTILQTSGQPVSPTPGTPPEMAVPYARPAEEAAPETQEKSKILAGWDNGFILRSADDNFHLRITGQIQADYRAFIDPVDYTDVDQFFLRRIRFGIEANLFKYYEFRLLPDYGLGQALIQDAYLNVHYIDELQAEVGRFKQPVSYEQLIQDRFVPTLERSLIDQLVPARDAGAMIHGYKLLGDKLDFQVSVSNGEINGASDVNDHKDISYRVVVRPFNWEELWPALHLIQLGVSGSTGVEEELVAPNGLKTPSGVKFFSFNSTVRADGLRNRLTPEASYFYGGLGLAAQYYYQEQVLQPAFTGSTSKFHIRVPTQGFYVLATYLLTGEDRTTYSQAVKPIRPFDPYHALYGYGAWEAVARVSRLHVDDIVFAKGSPNLASATLNSAGATEFTLGFNWYLNEYVRLQFNWEHDQFDENVRLGPGAGGILGHQDALMTRFQIIF